MNKDLVDKLVEFKNLTEAMIQFVKDEDMESVGTLLDKRGAIIQYILSLDFNNDELKKLFDEFEIIKLHNVLQEVMNNKKLECKDELMKLSKQKQAYNSYNNNFANKSLFIKKQI